MQQRSYARNSRPWRVVEFVAAIFYRFMRISPCASGHCDLYYMYRQRAMKPAHRRKKMAKSDIIVIKNAAAAAKFFEQSKKGVYAFNTGCKVYDLGNGKFEIYGGNANERDAIANIAAKMDVPEQEPNQAKEEAPATEKQIAFLNRLIDSDPATAMDCGARKGSAVSKSEASRMIDYMLNA